jgi:hypothetical protein
LDVYGKTFLLFFIYLLVDDEVDEDIHVYDVVELAFHQVVKFVVTYELLSWNYDDIMDGLHYFPLVMKLNHHLRLNWAKNKEFYWWKIWKFILPEWWSVIYITKRDNNEDIRMNMSDGWPFLGLFNWKYIIEKVEVYLC